MIQLSEHFTLDEMIFSDTAMRLGIDNSPTQLIIDNLQRTAVLMERMRLLLGSQSIRVHSGFRCPDLNAAVHGSKTSVHMLGLACDFTCDAFGSPLQVAKWIQGNPAAFSDSPFDQCIREYGWVHVGLPRPSQIARGEFLTKRSAAAPYEQGILA